MHVTADNLLDGGHPLQNFPSIASWILILSTLFRPHLPFFFVRTYALLFQSLLMLALFTSNLSQAVNSIMEGKEKIEKYYLFWQIFHSSRSGRSKPRLKWNNILYFYYLFHLSLYPQQSFNSTRLVFLLRTLIQTKHLRPNFCVRLYHRQNQKCCSIICPPLSLWCVSCRWESKAITGITGTICNLYTQICSRQHLFRW